MASQKDVFVCVNSVIIREYGRQLHDLRSRFERGQQNPEKGTYTPSNNKN